MHTAAGRKHSSLFMSLALPASRQRSRVAAWTQGSQEPNRVELNQGAAQRNHIGVRLDPRAIDRGIPNHQIELTRISAANAATFSSADLCRAPSSREGAHERPRRRDCRLRENKSLALRGIDNGDHVATGPLVKLGLVWNVIAIAGRRTRKC